MMVMVDEEVLLRAYRKFKHTSFGNKLRLYIKRLECTNCEQVIGNKQWEIHGDAVICVNCRYEIGSDGG